ncbi:protease I [Halogranum amylolyticum]|uniref:Protease I n=1 Tax=Halogranum amylolyticum TaxID=660520 RepID=A0A1H8TJH7_9EURY|nr:type 1 glutamine amidotransferase domain-containing protein [Halogranum amylolyticum]SEO91240.1 protease I [Halogranum amylolyticum]
MSDTEQSLDGTRIAILLAPRGTEEVEFTEPKQALAEAGADVDVVGSETGDVQTRNDDLEPGESFEVERAFSDVSADDYDGVVVPGGTVGADTLRADEEAVEFVESHVEDRKPLAAICHGPWMLVEAGLTEGRRLTSYHSLRTDIRNAGGEWVDEEVVTDDGVVTSRNPDDLSAFCETLVDEFAAR